MQYPAYLKLYEVLRRQIISGEITPGSRLPGKRPLAEQYGVSVLTVAHALDLLSEEGYISVRERSGCYASYGFSGDFPGPERSLPVPELQDLPSSADVEGFPFSLLARAMRRVIQSRGSSLLLKAPNQGLPALRQALSRYLARSRGISASPDQIVIAAGAETLYSRLVDTFGTDRIWAIESPSYEKIEQVYAARQVHLDLLPLDRNGIRSDALERTRASVLHVSPYRSFPSDITASASMRAEYLRWGEREGHLIIEDDFESEFSVRGKPLDTLFSQSARQNIVYLNTFSRTVSAAMRVGYMVLPAALLPLYQRKAGFYSCTVPVFEQYLLADLIDQGDFERHIRRVRRKLRSSPQE